MVFIFKLFLIAFLACVLEGNTKPGRELLRGDTGQPKEVKRNSGRGSDLAREVSRRQFLSLGSSGDCNVDLETPLGQCFKNCTDNQQQKLGEVPKKPKEKKGENGESHLNPESSEAEKKGDKQESADRKSET